MQSGRGGPCPAQDGFGSRLPLCRFWSDLPGLWDSPVGMACSTSASRGAGGSPAAATTVRGKSASFPQEAIVITDCDSLAISTPSAIRLEHTSARVYDLSKAHYSFYGRFFVKAVMTAAPAAPARRPQLRHGAEQQRPLPGPARLAAPHPRPWSRSCWKQALALQKIPPALFPPAMDLSGYFSPQSFKSCTHLCEKKPREPINKELFYRKTFCSCSVEKLGPNNFGLK